MFFKVRANRRVGKSKDPKNRVPEIAVPDLVKSILPLAATPRGVKDGNLATSYQFMRKEDGEGRINI